MGRARGLGSASKRGRRVALNLERVNSHTSELGHRASALFAQWLQDRYVTVSIPLVSQCPRLADRLLELFTLEIYRTGLPLYIVLHVLTNLQRQEPLLRHALPRSWRAVDSWNIAHPTEHRVPIPVVFYQAIVVVAILWGWPCFAAALVLSFRGVGRIGEPLRARRGNLLLPMDQLLPGLGKAYLHIDNPKTGLRLGGRSQHIEVQGSDEVGFLSFTYSAASNSTRIWPYAEATFRGRWNSILSALAVPPSLGFTPGGLRGGGAVHAYTSGLDISSLLWKMRLRSADTLRHYLQETVAQTSLRELSADAKSTITALASLYHIALRRR